MCAMYCVLAIVTCGYNQTTLFTTALYSSTALYTLHPLHPPSGAYRRHARVALTHATLSGH